MRDTEDRLTKMHRRAAEIKRKEDRSRLRVLGSLSGGLMVCLVVAMQQLGSMHHEMLTGQNIGSSLFGRQRGRIRDGSGDRLCRWSDHHCSRIQTQR